MIVGDIELLRRRSMLRRDFFGGRVQGRIDILEEWHEQQSCMDSCSCGKTTGDEKSCWFTERISKLRGEYVKEVENE